MSENQENQAVNLYGHDPQNVQKPGRDTRFVTAIPEGKDKAILCKLLYDPRGKQAYVPITFFKHLVGPDANKHTRSHPSLRSLGISETDPENDTYWQYNAELKELKALGKGETPEGKKLDALCKKFYPNDKGWLFVVTPESDSVQAVKITKAIINRLFGKTETQYRPAVPSLLKEMGQKGMSPYDLKSETGWVYIWKTGKGIATEYFIELAAVDELGEIDGQQVSITKPVRHKVGEKITNNQLVMSDFPNPVEFEKKYAFTVEETNTFIESHGTIVPERFLQREDETDEAPPAEGEDVTTVSVDDIPL